MGSLGWRLTGGEPGAAQYEIEALRSCNELPLDRRNMRLASCYTERYR